MTKQILLFFATAGLLAISFSSLAQTENELTHTAPSLQIGLEGLNFSRGNLDAQLIMQIVAEKQKEVGLRTVQNMFLNRMKFSGGAFYSFTDNIIKEVVNESDINVITKKLLENTVNITFSYAFADYYLKTMPKTSVENFNILAAKFAETDNMNFLHSELQKGLKGISQREGISATTNTKNANYSDVISLLVDMSSEAIRENKTLKDLGIMQVSYSQSYDFLNQYLMLKREKSTEYFLAKNFYDDMVVRLNEYTDMIGLLYFHLQSNSYRLNPNNILRSFNDETSINSISDLSAKLKLVDDNLTSTVTDMQGKYVSAIDTSKMRNILESLNKIKRAKSYISKAKLYYANVIATATTDAPRNKISEMSLKEEIIVNSDILYTIYADLIPTLESVSIWDSKTEDNIKFLRDACIYIQNGYKDYLVSKLNYGTKSLINTDKFISILSSAYQFDKANTFSNSVKLLAETEDLFPNNDIKKTLTFINTYIRDFVAIHNDKNGKEYIDLNIESLISKLTNIKSDRIRRISGLFTVGVNSIYFNKDLPLDNNETIRNYSFISEKIGVKLKVFDWSWQSRDINDDYRILFKKYKKVSPPSDPIISDLHLILYGSGILYNIINTGTTSNFNSPILSTGAGITFFNSLDLNLSYGIPILKNSTFKEAFNYGFIGVGFDFPFTEYIQRLNEKRTDNKNKKLIAEAAKN